MHYLIQFIFQQQKHRKQIITANIKPIGKWLSKLGPYPQTIMSVRFDNSKYN